MKAAWIAALTLIAFASWAQAPESGGTSHESPTEKSKPKEPEWQRDYPTPDNPFPVTVIESPKDAGHATEREKDSDQFNKDYLATQIRLAVASEKQATAACAATVIAFFGTLVAGFALGFLILTYWETRRAAAAASAQVRLTEQQFIAANRARIVVREVTLIVPINRYPTVKVSFVTANIGGTKAEVVESFFELREADNRWLRPIQENSNDVIGKGDILAGGRRNAEAGSTISPDEFMKINNSHGMTDESLHRELYFRGFVVYLDQSGVNHRTSVCRRFEPHSSNFTITNNPEYEYAD